MSSFICNAANQSEHFADVEGQITLEVDRSHKRPAIVFSIQITAKAYGEEAVFWIKNGGQVSVDRIAAEHELIAMQAGGFYLYAHCEIERLAFLAYRKTQQIWRFVGVAEVAGKQMEIDVDATVVRQIDWKCG